MERAEAEAVYERGRETVVAVLLELSAQSGVIGGVSQPLFAVGALKLQAPSGLTDRVHAIRDRIVGRRRRGAPVFEFKFSSLTRDNLSAHVELADSFFDCPQAAFGALILDKRRSAGPLGQADENHRSHTVWQRHLDLVARLVCDLSRADENLCLLVDDFGQPRCAASGAEHALSALDRDLRCAARIFGVCRIESHAAVLIQVADVLLGAVRYGCAVEYSYLESPDTFKLALSEHVRSRSGRPTWRGGSTTSLDDRFAVSEVEL